MKKSLKTLSLLTLLALVGCGGTSSSSASAGSSSSEASSSQSSSNQESSSNQSSSDQSSSTSQESSSDQSSSSSEEEKEFTLTGKIVDLDGNAIEGAKITLTNHQEITTSSTGTFQIEKVMKEDSTLSIVKDGFDTLTQDVSTLLVGDTTTIDLGNITLAKEYVKVGKLVDKTWENYEHFEIKVSRNDKGILIRALSNNNIFTSEGRNSRLELYFSVKDVSSVRNENIYQVNITNDGSLSVKNWGDLDVTNHNVTSTLNNGDKTTIDVLVPYQLLGIDKDQILGISAGLWSENDKDWAPMGQLEATTLALVENPKSYVRFDKENYAFLCEMNCYPEDVPGLDYDKDELIKDHPINVANPEFNNRPESADDIYVKVSKDETGFIYNMVGFGSFDDTEYLKLILHTSETDGNGWQLQQSDVTFLIGKDKAAKKTNLTDFWAYSNWMEDEEATNNTPTYVLDEKGYFTLDFKVDFTEIPNYTSDIEVSMLMVEFGNGVIYDGNPFENAMRVNNIGIGDPAAQTNYHIIQEKNLTVDKEELTKDKDIEFSIGGEHLYAKVTRNEYSLKLEMIAFATLEDNEFVRFIVHTSSTNNGGWTLDNTDVDFIIYKDRAYVSTNKTSFWEGEANNFHGEEQTLNNVEYFAHESGEYYTLSLEIDYTEIGLSVTKDTPMTALLVFFSGAIQNNGFTQNGEAKGDIADQNNYFTI